MAKSFRKYEFPNNTWDSVKENIQITVGLESEQTKCWNPDIVLVVVELGKLCNEWDLNESGNMVCVNQSSNFSVDIVWKNEPLSQFDQYLVWPSPVGVSSLGHRLNKDYANAYCIANPSADYCQPHQPPTQVVL